MEDDRPDGIRPTPGGTSTVLTDRLRRAAARLHRANWRGRRTRIALIICSVGLLGLAATLIVVGVKGQVQAPRPPRVAAAPVIATSAAAPPSVAAVTPSPGSAESDPVRIDIPAIKVRSSLIQLGRNADGTVQVPPLDDVAQAGWYRYSPTPGNTGPAVILGHIDSAQAGKGVFFDLGLLRAGDIVTVLRADHLIATFTVNRVLESPKTAFPASEVYGNTVDPELRLITCGGAFNSATQSYQDNILVFAALTSLKAA